MAQKIAALPMRSPTSLAVSTASSCLTSSRLPAWLSRVSLRHYLDGKRPISPLNPSRRIAARCNLSSNNVDVAAQRIHLIRKSERKTDVTDGVFDTFDFGLFFHQVLVV
jgi:hypothetical protein